MKRLVGVLGAMAGALALLSSCAPPPEDGGPVDLEPPVIQAVGVSMTEIAPGQVLTLSATVSDNVAVDNVIFLVGRDGKPSGFCSGSAAMVSGTPNIGTWELECTVPEVTNSGVYEVGVAAVDTRFNGTSTAEDPRPEVNATFTVLGDINDTDAPVIESVTTTPSTVAPGSQITISAHITDATGVSNVGFVVRRDMIDTMDWCGEGATLVSGSAQDGIWELTCTVGAGATVGQYRVNTVAADLLHNFDGIGDDGADAVAGPFTVALP